MVSQIIYKSSILCLYCMYRRRLANSVANGEFTGIHVNDFPLIGTTFRCNYKQIRTPATTVMSTSYSLSTLLFSMVSRYISELLRVWESQFASSTTTTTVLRRQTLVVVHIEVKGPTTPNVTLRLILQYVCFTIRWKNSSSVFGCSVIQRTRVKSVPRLSPSSFDRAMD